MAGGEPVIVREAPAKLNLGLRVTGRRADGFHEIESIFAPLALADTLELRLAAVDEFRCSDPALPAGDGNLAWRALQAWREAARGRPGLRRAATQPLRLDLTKRIPAGAGLGGGSSDAAATLLALEELFAPGLGRPALHPVALGLGSDVPFFLDAGWAHVAGRGEVLTPIPPCFEGPVIVVWPGLTVATGPAYARLSAFLTKRGGYATFVGFRGFADSAKPFARWPGNDFEAVLLQEHPFLADLKQTILDGGAIHASMTGSGSAVYGFFDSDRPAIKAAEGIRARHQATFLTRTRGSSCARPAAPCDAGPGAGVAIGGDPGQPAH
jgi:4-diphosphocytidyl-2-C-methyl-D-erythritol kinase